MVASPLSMHAACLSVIQSASVLITEVGPPHRAGASLRKPRKAQSECCGTRAGQSAHLAPQRTRKSGWKVWQGSQATTHCHSACGPDLNTSAPQPPAAGRAVRYDTYSPAINANVMNWICARARHRSQRSRTMFALLNTDTLCTDSMERRKSPGNSCSAPSPAGLHCMILQSGGEHNCGIGRLLNAITSPTDIEAHRQEDSCEPGGVVPQAARRCAVKYQLAKDEQLQAHNQCCHGHAALPPIQEPLAGASCITSN